MASAAPAPERYPVEEKTLFRIGEVSRITDTKTFVLRYWETEFPMLQPVKSPSGHRLYRREDIETVNKIKRLLYDEGFTIVGARKHLSGNAPTSQSNGFAPHEHVFAQSNGHVPVADASGTFAFSNSGFLEPHESDSHAFTERADAIERGSFSSAPQAAVASAAPSMDRETLLELRDELRAALTLLEDE
jgi:DNA-binding transcriptional MerR regulator